MANDKESDMVKVLSSFNPWWETHGIPYVEKFRRLDFEHLLRRLPSNEAISIVGARQVGKTTLMEQLIEKLLEQKIYTRILMIRGNNLELNTISKTIIKDCIDTYEKFILKEEITKTSEKVYIFIDEIQKIEKWFDIIRDYININRNIKFIVSGSSSVKIQKEIVHALVGRYQSQIVVPFKFLEVVRYNNFRNGKEDDNNHLLSMCYELRQKLRLLLESKEVTPQLVKEFFDLLEARYNELLVNEKSIKALLDLYFIKGGYPAVIKQPEFRICMETLATNIRDIINTDISTEYKIRDSFSMEKLLGLLSKDTAETVNVANISSILEKQSKTIFEYIKYLEDALLISTSENYNLGRVSRIRKKIKKIYMNDSGMRNVLNNTFSENVLAVPTEMGKIAETVVYNHCIRLKFKLVNQFKPAMFYWKDQGGEIDIILDNENRPLPIEVKYSNNIDEREFKTMKRFINEYNSGFGIFVTKDTFGIHENIIMIPIWLFLLIC